MVKRNKLSTGDKVFFIVLILFLVAILWVSISPVSFYLATGLPFITYYELPEPEPKEVQKCHDLNGICIDINIGCDLKSYFEYGVCKEQQICCIPDRCTPTKGRWAFEKVGPSSFSRKCLCPRPLEYDVKKGCSVVYE